MTNNDTNLEYDDKIGNHLPINSANFSRFINLSSFTSVLLICLVVFILPLAYWPELYSAASLPRYALIAISTSFILVFWAIRKQNNRIIWHPTFNLILIFFGWAALSTNWSPDPGTSLIDITQLLSMILFCFLGFQLATKPSFLNYLVPAILAGATLAAIIGIGQYFDITPIKFRSTGVSVPSTFINRNHAALYFDFVLPLAFVTILYPRKPFLKLSAATVFGLSLSYLIINGSRGSILALGVEIVAITLTCLFSSKLRTWLVLELYKHIRYIGLSFILCIIIINVPTTTPTATDEVIFQDNHNILNNTAKERLAMYINALPIIVDHPLTGLGLGGVRAGFFPYATSLMPITFRTETTVVRELHNDLLQYFVELGLPGGLLVILIYYLLIRNGFRIISSSGTTDKNLIVFGLWLGILACGAHSLVDFPLRLPSSAAMFWLFAGILLGLDANRIHPLSLQVARLLRSSITVVCFGLLTFSIYFYTSYLSANNDLYQAIVYGKHRECNKAAGAIEHGVHEFPLDFMLFTAYTQVYTYCDFSVDKKLTAMNRVLDHDPTNLLARLSRANLYIKTKNPAAAFEDYSLVAQSLPHRPAAYSGLGDVAVLEKNYPVALKYYQAALKRDKSYQHATQMIQRIKASSPIYKQ